MNTLFKLIMMLAVLTVVGCSTPPVQPQPIPSGPTASAGNPDITEEVVTTDLFGIKTYHLYRKRWATLSDGVRRVIEEWDFRADRKTGEWILNNYQDYTYVRLTGPYGVRVVRYSSGANYGGPVVRVRIGGYYGRHHHRWGHCHRPWPYRVRGPMHP